MKGKQSSKAASNVEATHAKPRRKLYRSGSVLEDTDVSRNTKGPPYADREAWLESNSPSILEYIRRSSRTLELRQFTVNCLRRQTFWRPALNTTWRDYAAEAASMSLNEPLRYLKELAFSGDARAVKSFCDLALNCTKELAELTQLQLAKVQSFAHEQRYWPVLKSWHPRFDTDHKAVLLQLELGINNPLNIVKGKWDPKDDVGKIAMQLWDQFEYLRTLDVPWGYESWTRAESRARGLPEFNAETWPMWAEVAEEHIRESYKEREDIKRLNLMVKASSRRIPSYKINSMQHINSHFFTMLKDKFRSMAGCNRE